MWTERSSCQILLIDRKVFSRMMYYASGKKDLLASENNVMFLPLKIKMYLILERKMKLPLKKYIPVERKVYLSQKRKMCLPL